MRVRLAASFAFATYLSVAAWGASPSHAAPIVDLVTSIKPDARFGELIVAQNDTIAVSARGGTHVFVFARKAGVWSEQQRLDFTSAAPRVVESLALDGDHLAVGLLLPIITPGAPGGSTPNGVQLFSRTGAAWALDTEVPSPTPKAGDGFGMQTQLSGNTLVVGAPGWWASAYDGPGAVYVFGKGSSGWTQQAMLSSQLAAPHDAFGTRVLLRTAGSGAQELLVGGNAHLDGSVSIANVQRFVYGAGSGWTYLQPVDIPSDAFDWDGHAVVFPTSRDFPAVTYSLSVLQYRSKPDDDYRIATDPLKPPLIPPGLVPTTGSVDPIFLGNPWASLSSDGTLAMTGPYYFPVHSTNAAITLSNSPYYAVVWQRGALPGTWTVRAVLGEHFSSLKDKVHDAIAGAFGTDYVVIGANSLDPANPGHAYVVPFSAVSTGALGTSCQTGFDCVSGSCIDGTCCDGQCEWACEQCGTDGKCTPTPAGTGCFALPPICKDNVQTGPVCNGNGQCDADPVTCDPFICGAKGCLHTCGADSDCLPGFACDLGKGSKTANECVKASTCDADGHTQVAPDGVTRRDCAPYRCAAGACVTTCASSADCLGGYTCDTAAKQCTIEQAASGKGGCATGVGAGAGSGALVSLLGLCSFLRRRRRRARS